MPRWEAVVRPVRPGRAIVVGVLALVVAALGLGLNGSRSESAGTAPPVTQPAPVQAAGAAAAVVAEPVRRIGMVGDSLLVEAKADVERELAGASLRIAAWPGLQVYQLHGEALHLADEVDVLVVVLGTNNVIDGWGIGDAGQVEALLGATAAAPCRRWVAITETGGIAHHDLGAKRANATLGEMTTRHAGLQIVPWNMLIGANPQYLHADQVHHTPEGRAAFARAIADAVRSCP